MAEFTPVTTPSKLVNANQNSGGNSKNKYTAVKEPSKLKFNEIIDKTIDAYGDATRLVNTGASSYYATIPSMPESLVNLGNLGVNYIGKKLGLVPETKQAGYIDIPYLPSYDEAKTFLQAPPRQIKYKESLLPQEKIDEIKMGLLDMKLIPNTPNYNKAYLTELEIASGDKPSLEMQTGAGKFLETPVEYYGMGKLFGKTSGIISGTAGVLESTLKQIGVNDQTAMVSALGTDVLLSLVAGLRNPSYVTKLQDSVQNAINNGKLNEAKDLLSFAKEYNIPLLGIEALAQTTKDDSLIKLAKVTAMSSEGSKYFKGLNGRELVLNDSANKFLVDFFGNENIRYLDVTQKTIDTLQNRLNSLRQNINKVARKNGYKQFDEFAFGEQVANELSNTLADLATSSNLNKSRANTFEKYALEIKGKNHKAVQSLSQELGQDIQKYKSGPQADRKQVAYLTEIKGTVDQTLKQIKGYESGSKTFQNLSKKILAPLDEAVTVNNQLKLNADATVGLLEKVLLGKQDNISITRLFNEVNKIDPKLSSEIAQALFTEVFSNIQVSPGMGKNMFTKVYGTPKQKKQVQAILTGVAKANGQNPAMYTKGFERMLETFNATSKLSGGESITYGATKMDEAMGLPNLKFSPLEIFDTIVANNNWNELAKIITSPNSLDALITLSKTPVRKNWPVIVQPIFQGYRQVEDKNYEETTQ
jgi:primosomal protein N''